jgi:hypothetical protein
MENKDIDNYFKDRSGTFNEAPGDALWAKIEAGIEAPGASKGSGGKWLFGVGGMVILGLALVWLLFPAKEDDNINKVVNHKKVIVPAATQRADTDTATRADTFAIKNRTTPQIVQGSRNKTFSVIKKAPAPVATTDKPIIEPQNTGGKEITPPPFDYKVIANNDKVEVAVTDNISAAERDSLIAATVTMNAGYPGRKIVIRVKGYDVYSYVIPTAIAEADSPLSITEPFTVKPGKVKLEMQTDTVFYDMIYLDTVSPDTLKFKASIPKQ